MDVIWNAPGPGMWERDASHFRGGTTPIIQSVMSQSMMAGMRRVMKELGAPAETLQSEFVNGFCYTRLRPLIGPDRVVTKLPPLPILKLVARLHPEMRRRAKAADRTLAERPWRQVTHHWETEGRRAIEADNLALQDVRLGDLSDDALISHTASVIAHCRKNLEHHFWLHGYDLGPIGRFLHECERWGLDALELLPLLEGASPSTSGPNQQAADICQAVKAAGADPATLAELRAISPAIATAVAPCAKARSPATAPRHRQ